MWIGCQGGLAQKVSGGTEATELSDLSVKSVRAALAAEHAAIAAHPQDPENYVSLAYTLSDAGMEEMARAAVRDATRAAPKSSFAFSAQGWVLHHNDIGVDYGVGFDYDGSLRAYRKAIELDPRELSVRESLGNLLDHDREGVDHAPNAQMGRAIEAYRYVIQHQSPVQPDTVRNLALDLFYTGRYEEAIKELTHYPLDDVGLGALMASVAAFKGSAAAIDLSSQIGGDEQRRKDALNMAAEGLWNKRLYPQATDLMTASLPDTAEGPAIAAKIQLFRGLKAHVPSDLPVGDPRRPVQELMEKVFSGTLDGAAVTEIYSGHSYAAGDFPNVAERESRMLTGALLELTKQTELPQVVIADIFLGRMTVQAGSETGNSRSIRVQVPGLPQWRFFVVEEEGGWKIAAGQREPRQVGEQALFLLANGHADTAKALLDWHFSQVSSQREANDPLSGDLFARLWTPSERAAAGAALPAAASLSGDEAQLRPLLPEIVKAREQASRGQGSGEQTTKERRADLDMLLATVYVRLRDATGARAVSGRLLEMYPNSVTALRLAGEAYALSKDWAAWRAMLAKPLSADPNDRRLLLESATEAIAEGDYARARQAYQAILDGTQMTSPDYTQYAWLSLFEGKPDDKAYAAAQQGALSVTRPYHAVLTMACLDAARGNAAEAHQELLEAMASAHLAQPNSGIWYGFGMLFEQYGVTEAAVGAYRKAVQLQEAEEVQDDSASELSAGTLARMRLKALGVK